MGSGRFATPVRVVSHPFFAKAVINGRLSQIDGVDVVPVDERSELASAIKDAQVLIMPGGGFFFDGELAALLREHAPELRWIQLTSAGYDGPERNGVPDGVVVTNNGGALGAPVAEHAVTLLLALARRLPEFWQNQSKQLWIRKTETPVASLEGRTIAVIGFGSIGREVALRARTFGMRVLGVRRTPTPDALADEMFAMADMERALGQADAVVISLPLNDDTRNVFDSRTLAACKPGAWIVNVGRGALVDTHALVDALHSGHIGGAGLDVVEPEPVPSDHPLWSAPNVLITPHIAGSGSDASYQRVADTIEINMKRYLVGEPLQHQVI
ncbi:D-2-hydroxyacid dehydrogenase [Hoeflea sp. WL0058]|uniref:D-2-hydroxyacid dehydrogenase n=1 Tax=Flavimaribacter sediminis TaxID=2865987 RepID=A0AAE2ZJ88_9HYPH|nr:D-2-hydroxyacid dehydrogenase [Flavimaribacter sediminis]MBW8637241.1 D-2-hydroxyacid dehydrogenase [Flavimaribacter sediminis]